MACIGVDQGSRERPLDFAFIAYNLNDMHPFDLLGVLTTGSFRVSELVLWRYSNWTRGCGRGQRAND